MEVPVFSLEELIDDATNINNIASNERESIEVANQVNRMIGGPSAAIKLLVHKLHRRQEVVTLQVLNVLEVCVKNCGVKFHNEVGKYKFINELIKLLSSKYDGDITPPSVKERVISLLYSWYVGLPQETKIGEAYKMLKQQGIITRDPIDQNGTQLPRERENTAFHDEGNTELLKTLLSSKDAEDLHSANKLIKTMVKEEEERLDRIAKRIQFLETVSNNVKLLDELLETIETGTENSNQELMNDLYERCLTLRPELFRLASKNVDDKDDSVGEILMASDELTRVIDLYKEKVLFNKSSLKVESQNSTSQDSSFATSLLDLDVDSPTQETDSNSLLNEQFKMLGLEGPGTRNNLPNQMNDNPSTQFPALQFDPMVASIPSGNQYVGAHGPPAMFAAAPNMNLASGNPPIIRPPTSTVPTSVPKVENAAVNPKPKDPFDFDIFNSFNSSSDFLKPSNKNTGDNGTDGITTVTSVDKSVDELLSLDEPSEEATNVNLLPISTLHVEVKDDACNPPILPPPIIPPQNTTTSDVSNVPSVVPAQVSAPLTSPLFNGAPVNPPQPAAISSPVLARAPVSPPISIAAAVSPVATPAPITVAAPAVAPSQITREPTPAPCPVPSNQSETAQPAGNYLVPLEALKPGKHAPIPILDKDGIKTFLIIAEDTRENANANVIVTILSTISLNTDPVKDFSIQVAVPKVMRVKLQPATTNDLAPFNPILPPPSISQIMLIANPTKEAVRLRFKVLYNISGVSNIETSSIDQLPVT